MMYHKRMAVTILNRMASIVDNNTTLIKVLCNNKYTTIINILPLYYRIIKNKLRC